jgi:TPR repeat protein
MAPALLVAILATPACTRSKATAGAPQAEAGQTSRASQSLATQLQPASTLPGLSAPVADAFREAQAGSAQAMATLGNAYEKGEGAPQDLQQALLWFSRAAETGDSYAMYRLGRINAVQKDYKEAVRWYRKGAAAGNADAMYCLGQAYENGSGVREDVQQAVDWYDEATLRGNKSAKAALERLGESFDR